MPTPVELVNQYLSTLTRLARLRVNYCEECQCERPKHETGLIYCCFCESSYYVCRVCVAHARNKFFAAYINPRDSTCDDCASWD